MAVDRMILESEAIEANAIAWKTAMLKERERCAQLVETMTSLSAYAVVIDAGKVIAAYNGHVHARCKTEGCVSWME